MDLKAIFGWGSIGLGLLMIISFPSVEKYTPDKFSHAGIILGIFLIALGIFLIKT